MHLLTSSQFSAGLQALLLHGTTPHIPLSFFPAVLTSACWYLELYNVSCYYYYFCVSQSELLAAPLRVLILSQSLTLAHCVPSNHRCAHSPSLLLLKSFQSSSLYQLLREPFPESHSQRALPFRHRTLTMPSVYIDLYPLSLSMCLNSPQECSRADTPEPSYCLCHGCASCRVLSNASHRIRVPYG